MDKQKKRLKKNDEYMQGLMQGQEKLLEMVRRQDEKNRRLEDHLASGLNVKSLGKNDPRKQAENQYDPLDDISFEDEEQVLAELMQPKRKKKKKPKSDTEEPLMNQMLPMHAQHQDRYAGVPDEWLADGGFAKHGHIEQLVEQQEQAQPQQD